MLYKIYDKKAMWTLLSHKLDQKLNTRVYSHDHGYGHEAWPWLI